MKEQELTTQVENSEVINNSKDLLESIISTTDAKSSKEPMTEERYRNMKLVLGFMNAYLKSHEIQQRYFQLQNLNDKLVAASAYAKRMKK